MTFTNVSSKAKLALCAVVLGIGAQLAPEASVAADLACIRACNIAKQACLRAARQGTADDIAACYSEWTECLGECNQ